MQLPSFKYHPNPLTTGSVISSSSKCKCCKKRQGYIYVGSIYSIEELEESICPWCIKDGSAHEKFDAEFVDFEGVGGYGKWEKVTSEIIEEICFRTPGFNGWQQEQWWTHCGDAAEFLGPAGYKEVIQYGKELILELKNQSGLDDFVWEKYLTSMSKENSPTAYIFKCRKCGKFGGYADCK